MSPRPAPAARSSRHHADRPHRPGRLGRWLCGAAALGLAAAPAAAAPRLTPAPTPAPLLFAGDAVFQEEAVTPWLGVNRPITGADRDALAAELGWWAAEPVETPADPTDRVGRSSVVFADRTAAPSEADSVALTWWAQDGDAEDFGAEDFGQEDFGTEDFDAPPADTTTPELPADDAGTDDAGTDDAGTDDAGTDDAGTDDAAMDDAGTDDAAMDDGADADDPEATGGDEFSDESREGAIAGGDIDCDSLPCLFTPLREISLGLNTPTVVLASKLETADEGTCERDRAAAYRTVEPPRDVAGACYAALGVRDETPFGPAIGKRALNFRFVHRPLYFENPNLERCGIDHGCAEDVVGAAHFVGTTLLLPWWVATRPQSCVVRATPFCPPGCEYSVADNYLPPAEIEGAAAQAAVTTGLFFLIP